MGKELEGSTFDLRNLKGDSDYYPNEHNPVSVLNLHGNSIDTRNANGRYQNTPMYKDTIALSDENLTERNSSGINRSIDLTRRKKREQKKIRQDV